MGFTECHNCKNKVPVGGQCNNCGFVNGLFRPPSDDEFKKAREINEIHGYEHFKNLDMALLDLENELMKE